jgi:Icc protein
VVTIAHISDPHVGSPYFVPNLMNRVIVELNELQPDVVVCTGDLTNEGYRQEYKNWVAYQERIRSPIHVVPGNHDARNVGYVHFEELIGPRHWAVDVRGVRIVGVDSSEPDLNEGQVGRERYPWIRERFAVPADLKVFVLHHHLIPVPGTGRERSTVADAGDLLELLIDTGVNIVLTGHKHVPYVWRLETLYIVNAGTCASLRLRGYTRPCYNIVEVEGDEVRIHRKFPFGGKTVLAHFSLSSGVQYQRQLEALIQEPQAGVPLGSE